MKRFAATTLGYAALFATAMSFVTLIGSVQAANSDCATSKNPAVLLRIRGFKDGVGNVIIRVYGDNPNEFLKGGKRLLRLQLPVPSSGAIKTCIALPEAGAFAIAVHHDLQGDGVRDWGDGIGFSGNPPLSLFKLKPPYSKAAFFVGNAVKPVDVTLLYRYGFSIRSDAKPASQ